MDWNNDGKYDWQDTAMDMYVMDKIHEDNGSGYALRNSSSSGKAIALIVVWILLSIFIGFMSTL